jgi:hypothetical protein
MQSAKVKIRGIAPMLQNRYPMEGDNFRDIVKFYDEVIESQ